MSSLNNTISNEKSSNNNNNNNSNLTDHSSIIRVGSRKSELALIQTRHVIALLQKQYPQNKFEIRTMTTMGDRILNISLPKIGEKSLFTKDLEDALKNGSVDFVVHSLKDLPTTLPEGMAIGAVLEREDPRDALVLAKQHEGESLSTLPSGSVIGTSSLRRAAQLSRKYPHLKVQDIRGNLNTRLSKLDAADSKFAGIILAQAGLVRMGWQNRISQTIEPDDILYAVGQGALAVECRSNNTKILQMLKNLCCLETQCKILTERSFLKTLGGGCSAPVAIQTTFQKTIPPEDEGNVIESSNDLELLITGAVWSLDGQTEINASNKCLLKLRREQKRNSDEISDTEHTPAKKPKLDDENSLNGNNLSPPKIVDMSTIDDNVISNNNKLNETQAHAVDLAGLINIHSDAFKKCPYSSVLKKESLKTDSQTTNDETPPIVQTSSQGLESQSLPENTTTSSTQPLLKCPLHFSIGQDVMGQCPYVDTSNQQVTQLLTEATETVANKPLKCPFDKSNVAPNKENPLKCPFLAASTSKAVDHSNEGSDNLPNKEDEYLYCGLYRHKCWPLDIFERCERLGIDLAQQLIEKGALQVMECAQKEIRKNI